MVHKSGRIFPNFFQIGLSQFKKGHNILSIRAIVTWVPLILPTLAAWKKDELSSAANIFRRWLKKTTPLTSSSWKQHLVVIVTTCGPATTIEINFLALVVQLVISFILSFIIKVITTVTSSDLSRKVWVTTYKGDTYWAVNL